MWCDVMWCDVMWCDVMWCDVMWCNVMDTIFWLSPSIESCNWIDFISVAYASWYHWNCGRTHSGVNRVELRATWATDQQHQCHIECFINLRAGQPGQSEGQPRNCPQLVRCSYATACEHSARLQPSINLHAPVTAFMFSCCGTQCTTPEGWRLG